MLEQAELAKQNDALRVKVLLAALLVLTNELEGTTSKQNPIVVYGREVIAEIHRQISTE